MNRRSLSVLLVSVIVLASVVMYSADAAGIPKKAISTVSRFLESDLPTTTVFTDVTNTITAAITMNSLTLGGAENANNHQINSLAAPTSGTDAVNANNEGLLGSLVVGKCSNNNHLKYQTSNTTWICDTGSYLTSAITSINLDSTPGQTISGGANITVSNNGAIHSIALSNAAGFVLTGGSAQTITKALTDTGQLSVVTGSSGFTLEDPTTTSKQIQFSNSGASSSTTLTIAGEQTTSQTLHIPNISGTDTLATLGLSQTWGSGAKQTFTPSASTAGVNIGSVSSDPSSPANGDLWTTTGGALKFRANGITKSPINSAITAGAGTLTSATVNTSPSVTVNTNDVVLVFISGTWTEGATTAQTITIKQGATTEATIHLRASGTSEDIAYATHFSFTAGSSGSITFTSNASTGTLADPQWIIIDTT